MKGKEFNLSNERRCLSEKFCYLEKDVKEFIKIILEDIRAKFGDFPMKPVTIIKEIIKKRAGDKLI